MGARKRVPAILGAAHLRDSDGAPSTKGTKRSAERNRARSQQLELGRARGIGDRLFFVSEGKGHKFDSCRARHNFNDLGEFAKDPVIAAEAPRKHSTGNIWTDCHAPVAPGLTNRTDLGRRTVELS
jgi:hypothetical protein